MFKQKRTEKFVHFCCRSPHGERGLKFGRSNIDLDVEQSLPHGERGLKFVRVAVVVQVSKVAPQGAWIEISWTRMA